MADIRDIYAKITNRIIADLEQGTRPWIKPWRSGHAAGTITRPLRHTGIPYKGINVVTLWSAAVMKGHASPFWLTYRQALELGGHIRRGETGEPVVYASTITRADPDETERTIAFLKGYTVFNAEQCTGLPAHYTAPLEPAALTSMQRLARADQFFVATGADVRHGGTAAYYVPQSDHVQMPPFETFTDPESYAATLAHELIHWTAHPNRLARDLGRITWGDDGYAKEELVAELGAAFLCADLAITPTVREDHAAYIGFWLAALRHDKRLIFMAAAHAQRAADYLHGLQSMPLMEAGRVAA